MLVIFYSSCEPGIQGPHPRRLTHMTGKLVLAVVLGLHFLFPCDSPEDNLNVLLTWWLDIIIPRVSDSREQGRSSMRLLAGFRSHTMWLLPYSFGHTNQIWFSGGGVYTSWWITEDRVHWGLSWKLATTPWNASPVPPANTLNVRNTFLPCLTELKVVINLIYEFLIRSRLSINSNYRLFLQVNWGVGLGVSSCLHINICACTTTI